MSKVQLVVEMRGLDTVKPQEARPTYRDEERNHADARHVVSASSGS